LARLRAGAWLVQWVGVGTSHCLLTPGLKPAGFEPRTLRVPKLLGLCAVV
jgi:hypothetical protein